MERKLAAERSEFDLERAAMERKLSAMEKDRNQWSERIDALSAEWKVKTEALNAKKEQSEMKEREAIRESMTLQKVTHVEVYYPGN